MGVHLEQVSVGYGNTRVIENVSLTVNDGEFVSVIGPNGAGKTTLMNAISGHLRVMSGRILKDNTDMTRWKADRRARAGVGRSFQTTHLFPNLSVRDNVLLAVQARHRLRWFDMFSRQKKAHVEEACDFLNQVELLDAADKDARSLSHGDKRKLELAMLLSMKPQILLLDEPTAGMAVSEVPSMLNLIERLKDTGTYSIMLVEHKLDVVMRLSNRVVVLQQGRMIVDGSPQDIMKHPEVRAAYLGGQHEGLA